MSFTAPLWLAAVGLIAAGVVIAHLFSTNVPPKQVLPTVRFVPQGAPLAVLRTRRLTDLWLLLLRLAAISLIGLALAGAHLPRSGPSRVVLLDASRAVDASRARRTAHAESAAFTEDADIIVFDSTARRATVSVIDTLTAVEARGSLSAGIVAAHRAISGITRRRNDIELVIVSPVVKEEVDSATISLLALWEGPVRIVRVPAAEPKAPIRFEVRATGDDPVSASLQTLENPAGTVRVRVVRDRITEQDSVWARSGNVLVEWLSAASELSADSAFAVATPTHTVVGIAKPSRQPRAGQVLARWSDGAPAATEAPLGAGCVRDVAIPVDPVGDIALRSSFRGLAHDLLAPCGGLRDFTPVPDSALLPRAKQASSSAATASAVPSTLPPLLAALALVVLIAERLVRRTKRAA